jgi:hypothetical protein
VNFYCPKTSVASSGFEPMTLGSSGKRTNHCTAKATNWVCYLLSFEEGGKDSMR